MADQTNDFAVDERGEAVGEDGIMSAHPPAYVRNRLKDEKSQEILSQMNNSQLLGTGANRSLSIESSLVENGTLTPGSHLQKQKKVSRVNQMKQQNLDLLYQELEAEMQSVLDEMQVTETGEPVAPSRSGSYG